MGLGRTLGILLGAMLCALVLWAYVRLSQPFESDVDLPLAVEAPKGYAITNNIPAHLHARVRGPGWQILWMSFSSSHTFDLDLAKRSIPESEQGWLTIRGDELSHAAKISTELRLLTVDPDSIRLHFVKRIRMRMAIVSRADVIPAKGYVVVGSPVLKPDSVTLEGSPEVLVALGSFPTKAIVVRNAREDVQQSVELSDTLANYLTIISPQSTILHVDIQQLGEKTFHDVPITIEAVPPGRSVILKPDRINVIVRGGVDDLAAVKDEAIHVRVMYDPVLFDTAQSVVPAVDVPKSVSFLQTSPSRLNFVVRKETRQSTKPNHEAR